MPATSLSKHPQSTNPNPTRINMDIDITDRAPETKAGLRGDNDAHDELMRAFEEYRATNDDRLAQLERRKGDVLLEEKVARLDAVVDNLTLKQARPHLGAAR